MVTSPPSPPVLGEVARLPIDWPLDSEVAAMGYFESLKKAVDADIASGVARTAGLWLPLAKVRSTLVPFHLLLVSCADSGFL